MQVEDFNETCLYDFFFENQRFPFVLHLNLRLYCKDMDRKYIQRANCILNVKTIFNQKSCSSFEDLIYTVSCRLVARQRSLNKRANGLSNDHVGTITDTKTIDQQQKECVFYLVRA